MDGNGGMNMRNWGFFEPQTSALKGHLGLQLMSTMAEKPLFGGSRDGNNTTNFELQPLNNLHHHHAHPAVMNGGPFHHHRVGGIAETSIPMDYMRDAWINHNREKYLNVLAGNNHQHHHQTSNYDVLAETSTSQSMQMIQQPKNENIVSQINVTNEEREAAAGVGKKRGGVKAQKSPKPKKAKRAPRAPRNEFTPPVPRARVPKKNAEVVINGINLDISEIPIPVCSCTGTPQQCYRWGSGGWQSACCTTGMSMYPLPMSTKRRGARIAGRKMSLGAFKKVLEKLASEGYNFSNPIDLRTYWAKHGTNKFVTIR